MSLSTQYPVLGNRTIDQWKVVELKEELKRRSLTTKGLKDDLIKRLAEAIHIEREALKDEEVINNEKGYATEDGNRIDVEPEPQVSFHDARGKLFESPIVEDSTEHCELEIEKLDQEGALLDKSSFKLDQGKFQDVNILVSSETIEPATQQIDPDDKILVYSETTEPATQQIDPDDKILVSSETTKPTTQQIDPDDKILVSSETTEPATQQIDPDDKILVSSETTEPFTPQVIPNDPMDIEITDSKGMVSMTSGSEESQKNEIKVEEDPKPPSEDAVLNVSNPANQVSEASPTLGFQVKSDSISTSLSINEKNDLKDNLNTDNFHIELDKVKPEMVQPSSSDVPPGSGDIHPLDVHEPSAQQGSLEERDERSSPNVDLSNKNDNTDGAFSEKLNLDRSSGDDSMEEDVLESKQVDSVNDCEVRDRSELSEDLALKEENLVSAARAGFSPDKKDSATQNNNNISVPSEKRKIDDQEPIRGSEPPKRQRRWNSESVKIPETKSSGFTPLTTPKDAFQSSIPKRNFSRSDSTLSGGDTPKERVVPPSQKSPSNSLRIDNFLRPFTLKAVQELLGKTGTVCSFWMDHIKTHCYVTFSSVEEATETRNAVYNLQWPTNGGKLLVADFVNPQEVKIRAEAPLQSPVTPGNTKIAPPAQSQLQPSPRQHVPKQHVPAPPLLPTPPTLSDPPTTRERLPPPPPITKSDPPRERLPPPPPLARKPDPPIVTLDDLFRKTKATPRIYYLPLSEEEVAAKLATQQRKNNK